MSIHPTAPAPQTSPDHTTSRARDVVTVILLLGSVVFMVVPYGILWASIAWATGAVLLWTSTNWLPRDKALGTLVWPGGLVGPVLLLTGVGQVCTQSVFGDLGQAGRQALGDPVCTGFSLNPWVGVPVSLLVFAAPFLVATRLLNRVD